MIYLDSTLFIIASLDQSDKGQIAKDILIKIHKGNINAFTSALTFDEVLWKVMEITNRENAINVCKNLLKINNLTIVDVTTNILLKSLDIMEKYNLDPRDAIHASSAIINNINIIFSEDKDFDKIKEIKRKQI